MVEIRFTLNGEPVTARARPALPAVRLLREILGLTGTKPGCEEGECGACTVLLDGEAVNSCLVPAALLEGRDLVTVEGLAASDGSLHPVQRAFVEAGAIQCGFCTPGMILTAKAVLDEEEDPTEEIIKKRMAGNLCRCTGYKKIVEAVLSVKEQAQKGE